VRGSSAIESFRVGAFGGRTPNPEDMTAGLTNRDSKVNRPRIALQMALFPCSEAGCISRIAFVRIGNLGKIRGLEEHAFRISRFAVA